MPRVYDMLCEKCGQPARENEACEYCGHNHENMLEEYVDASETNTDEADEFYECDTALEPE